MSATGLYNIVGTSTVTQKANYTPRVNKATGKQIGPFIGEVISDWFTGTLMEALVQRAKLARLHRSSDFTVHTVPR